MRSILQTLILTFVIFFLVRAAIQNFVIQGASMEPSLKDGQLLLVNKLSYRLHPPRRGDVIVARSPTQPEIDVIKRVIALPGETIEVRNGITILCISVEVGKEVCGPLEESYAQIRPGEYMPSLKVLPDHVFVIGDNRGHSTDSRSWGSLPRKNIIGRAWLSLWPMREWGFAPNYSWAAQR